MVLVVEKKFLEGTWWKWALGLAVAQVIAWLALGFKLQPKFNPFAALWGGAFYWIAMVIFAVLPFVVGRRGFKRLFWFGLIGFILGDLAYFILANIPSVRALGGNLPFIAFAQLNTALLSLGLIVEFGTYVYRKVFEE